MTLFPFATYWWFYLGFTAFVLVLLALDLGVFHRKAHAVSFREATIWSVIWISLAMAFNYGFYRYALWNFSPEVARQAGLEFLTGYVIEKTLSLDNIFVFVGFSRSFGSRHNISTVCFSTGLPERWSFARPSSPWDQPCCSISG